MQGKSTLGVLLEPAGSVAALRAFDAMVHRIAAARNVTGLENLTNLDQFPPRGATVIALPMQIVSASGGPLRAVALVPQ